MTTKITFPDNHTLFKGLSNNNILPIGTIDLFKTLPINYNVVPTSLGILRTTQQSPNAQVNSLKVLNANRIGQGVKGIGQMNLSQEREGRNLSNNTKSPISSNMLGTPCCLTVIANTLFQKSNQFQQYLTNGTCLKENKIGVHYPLQVVRLDSAHRQQYLRNMKMLQGYRQELSMQDRANKSQNSFENIREAKIINHNLAGKRIESEQETGLQYLSSGQKSLLLRLQDGINMMKGPKNTTSRVINPHVPLSDQSTLVKGSRVYNGCQSDQKNMIPNSNGYYSSEELTNLSNLMNCRLTMSLGDTMKWSRGWWKIRYIGQWVMQSVNLNSPSNGDSQCEVNPYTQQATKLQKRLSQALEIVMKRQLKEGQNNSIKIKPNFKSNDSSNQSSCKNEKQLLEIHKKFTKQNLASIILTAHKNHFQLDNWVSDICWNNRFKTLMHYCSEQLMALLLPYAPLCHSALIEIIEWYYDRRKQAIANQNEQTANPTNVKKKHKSVQYIPTTALDDLSTIGIIILQIARFLSKASIYESNLASNKHHIEAMNKQTEHKLKETYTYLKGYIIRLNQPLLLLNPTHQSQLSSNHSDIIQMVLFIEAMPMIRDERHSILIDWMDLSFKSQSNQQYVGAQRHIATAKCIIEAIYSLQHQIDLEPEYLPHLLRTTIKTFNQFPYNLLNDSKISHTDINVSIQCLNENVKAIFRHIGSLIGHSYPELQSLIFEHQQSTVKADINILNESDGYQCRLEARIILLIVRLLNQYRGSTQIDQNWLNKVDIHLANRIRSTLPERIAHNSYGSMKSNHNSVKRIYQSIENDSTFLLPDCGYWRRTDKSEGSQINSPLGCHSILDFNNPSRQQRHSGSLMCYYLLVKFMISLRPLHIPFQGSIEETTKDFKMGKWLSEELGKVRMTQLKYKPNYGIKKNQEQKLDRSYLSKSRLKSPNAMNSSRISNISQTSSHSYSWHLSKLEHLFQCPIVRHILSIVYPLMDPQSILLNFLETTISGINTNHTNRKGGIDRHTEAQAAHRGVIGLINNLDDDEDWQCKADQLRRTRWICKAD